MANIITGTSGDDGLLLLQGDTTDDNITGLGGNDTIEGVNSSSTAEGNDTLDGGTGTDTLTFQDETIGAVTISLAITTAQSALGGNVTISNFENLTGSTFNDSLTGDANANKIQGGWGNDTLIGGNGADTLDGGVGTSNTVNYGSEGGTNGILVNMSTVTASMGTATIVGGYAIDTYSSADQLFNIQNITGTGLADWIIGSNIGNKLDGGAGNDTIEGFGGADTLIGGAGTDTLSFANSAVLVNVNLAKTTTQATIGGGTITQSGFENLTGSNAGNDTLLGDAAANTVLGLGGNDSIDGAAGADSLDGGNGNDTISGGLANDTIVGGAGTDVASYAGSTVVNVNLNSGTGTTGATVVVGGVTYTTWGTDSLSGVEGAIGSIFSDTLTGDANANYFSGGAGADTIVGGNGADTIDGGLGVDFMDFSTEAGGGAIVVNMSSSAVTDGTGTVNAGKTRDTFGALDQISNVELITGTSGADWMIGNYLSNKFIGGSGNDTLEGGGGLDTLDGGVGTDTLDFTHAILSVTVNLAQTTAQNTFGGGVETITNFENLTGSAYNDTLKGDANGNVITGAAGDDTIFGGLGNDTLNGGANGAAGDTASYAGTAGAATSAITANLALGTVTGGAGSDSLSGIENLIGTKFNDTITGDTNANVLEGGAGDDTLTGGGGTDTASYASAAGAVTVNLSTTTAQNTVGAGFDQLSGFLNAIGGVFNDKLTGTSGNNVLEGGVGNDTLIGNGGNDTASYEHSSAAVSVNLNLAYQNTIGAGWDRLTGIANLLGGKGNDKLTGDVNANSLNGSYGDDTLIGGAGADTLDGGLGGVADTVNYGGEIGTVGVSVNMSAAAVNMIGGVSVASNAALDTFSNVDSILNIENLTGTAFADWFIGSTANNKLDGAAGADTLDGGAGNDTLLGGAGADSLTGGAGNDIFQYASSSEFGDTISDFTSAADVIRVSSSIGGGLTANMVANVQLGTAATGTAAAFVYDNGTGSLWFDSDGTGATAKVLIATLSNKPGGILASDVKIF